MIAEEEIQAVSKKVGVGKRIRLIAEVAIVGPMVASIIFASPSLAVARGATPYEFDGTGPSLNARYEAYLPAMRATVRQSAEVNGITADIARHLAPIWWHGFENHKLLPLPQIRFDESSFDGATGQILRRTNAMEVALRFAASQEAWDGNPWQSVEDALDSMRYSRILKYSDATTLSMADASMRRNLETIQADAPRLTPAQAARTRSALAELRSDGTTVVTMLNRIYDLYVHEQSATQNITSDLPNFRPIREAKSNVDREAALQTALGHLPGVDAERASIHIDPFTAVCRRSLQNEISTEKSFEEVESVLASVVQSKSGA